MTMNFAYDFSTPEIGSVGAESRLQWELAKVRSVFAEQARAVAQLADKVGDTYLQAVEMLYHTAGHVVVCGMGKSGLVAKKIAATLASTGTPAFFLHPGEAYHGDLGMVTSRDSVILISYSGETEEVVKLLPHIKAMGAPVVALVGRLASTLGRGADLCLDCSVEKEVCPNNLAPTSSTLAAMAMGDALAVSLIHRRDFGPRDFARFHPGGSLGRKLLTRARDVMYKGTLPIAGPNQTVREALLTMTSGRMGVVLVMEGDELRGLVSDGDLRRALQKFDDLLEIPLWRIMTKNPVTISEDMMVAEAEELMRRKKIKVLVALDRNNKVSGILDIFED
ncbi:MAG: KpsF/GutQ family sugar-phosphate isomerase [Myxococcota bacterium]|jgi:arabinose-5-phosphate isomerase|nr:KpsF/GutQ family sugar-phosphate isomerase [Myxococcota bacterium]